MPVRWTWTCSALMMPWYQKRHAPSWFSHESALSSHARATSFLLLHMWLSRYSHIKKKREAEEVVVRMVNDFLHRSRPIGSDTFILSAKSGIPLERRNTWTHIPFFFTILYIYSLFYNITLSMRVTPYEKDKWNDLIKK